MVDFADSADEDNLDREVLTTSATPPAAATTSATPKRRGPPKGSPKQPGSGRKRSAGSDRVRRLLAGDASQAKADADAIFRVRAPEIAAKLVSRALGEAEMVTGPTGKQQLQYPKQASQDRALEIVSDKLWPSLKVSDVTSTSHVTTAAVQPTEADLRRALAEHLQSGASAPASASGAPVVDERPSDDISQDVRAMKAMLPGRDADAFVDWPPASDDPGPPPAPKPAPTIASGDNSDRIELGEGYFAVRGKNSTGAEVWFCYAPGAGFENNYSAIKRSREQAVDWFHNNTPAGQALSKGLRIVK